MKFTWCAALSMTLIANISFAHDLIGAGVYKYFPTAERPPYINQVDNKRETNIYKKAIPKEAGIGFAIVANDGEMNKILFLTAKDFKEDRNQEHGICRAYAGPNWNYYSNSQPFCRTTIGSYDPQFSNTDLGFMFKWQDETKNEDATYVPPKRDPNQDERVACAALGHCPKEGYGYYIENKTITHFEDSFAPISYTKYRDIIYLESETPAYFSNLAMEANFRIPADSFIAVKSIKGDWVDADYFENSGTPQSLSIRRMDLVNGDWKVQKAQSKDYKFIVASEKSDDYIQVQAIQIIDKKTNKRVQSFYDIDSDLSWAAPDEVVNLVDANFDGYLDISIFGHSGGAGPNSTENIYLFNPKTKKFEFNQTLSEFTQLEIDSKKKTILTAMRDGCCDHSSETYKWVNGKLLLVETWHEYLRDVWVYTERGKRINGKMRIHTERQRARE